MYSIHFTPLERAIAVYVIDAGKTETPRGLTRPHFRRFFRPHAFSVFFRVQESIFIHHVLC